MLGSEYPDAIDAFTAPNQAPLAAAIFGQVMAILENTQRAGGQGLGDLAAIGNTTDATFGAQFKRLLRVDFGVETYTIASGTSITSSNQGTRELTVSFNTYGGSTVFNTAANIRVFVTEAGGQVNAKTLPQINGNRKDTGNIVDGSVTTSQFKWRHDETNAIGTIMWLAVEWAE
jgi:hypothetical protein